MFQNFTDASKFISIIVRGTPMADRQNNERLIFSYLRANTGEISGTEPKSQQSANYYANRGF